MGCPVISTSVLVDHQSRMGRFCRFLSERETADRNYALGYYMREHKCFPEGATNLVEILDFYFQVRMRL